MHQSDCPTLQRLTSYLEGSLPPDEAWKVEQHLESCPSCEAVAQQQERGIDAPFREAAMLETTESFDGEPEFQRLSINLRGMADSTVPPDAGAPT